MYLVRLRIFFFLIVCSFSTYAQQPLTLPITIAELEAALADTGLCNQVSAAEVCRSLPWIARGDEGAIIVRSTLVIFLRQKPPMSSPETLISKLEEVYSSRRLEIKSLMYLSSSLMSASLTRSDITNLLVILFDPLTPKRSVLFSSRSGVINFLSSTSKVWQQEITDSLTWEPPKDFKPFYQFESF